MTAKARSSRQTGMSSAVARHGGEEIGKVVAGGEILAVARAA